jgi:negative regulator of replication initiation
MNEPKVGQILESLKLENSDEFCEEEKAIIRFVNGETDIDQFFNEVDDAYGQR